jgi:predicted kinase
MGGVARLAGDRPTTPRRTVVPLANTQDSLALHQNGNNELRFERTLLHAAICEDLLRDRSRHSPPTVVFMAGGPASGKSTLITQLGLAVDAIVIDVDRLREELPEYAEWQTERPEDAANLTHREASQIAKQILAAALERGHDVVFDAAGGDDDDGFSSKIRGALQRGVRVRVCYATVPVELAEAREAKRFAETHRRVPTDILRSKHSEVSRGLANVAALKVDLIEVYDTSTNPPRLLAHGAGGGGLNSLEVVDQGGYADFLSKGQT